MTNYCSICGKEYKGTVKGMCDIVCKSHFTDTDTYTFAEAHKITEFQLKLGDGSTVTVPCTEIDHLKGTTVLAAAIHHLIQRVAALEALQADSEVAE
tara:strand:+ start:132 stop:422 length:291 start_codon:yes stop_codon:yes gene_type:complete